MHDYNIIKTRLYPIAFIILDSGNSFICCNSYDNNHYAHQGTQQLCIRVRDLDALCKTTRTSSISNSMDYVDKI
jgi:hypothetical protein